jgi:hypothetical protein
VGTTRYYEFTWFRSGERNRLVAHFTAYLEITTGELERLVMAVVERNLQAQRAVMEQWTYRYNGEHLLKQSTSFAWGGEGGAPTYDPSAVR